MTARHDYRSNAKAHRFVMAPSYVTPKPAAPTWPRRLFWAGFGVLTMLGLVCFLATLVGAALTLAGVK